MPPPPKYPKGSEQYQDDCTGENFVHNTAVSQIDRKQRGQKRDLPHFFVNTVLQDQTELESCWFWTIQLATINDFHKI